MKKWKSEQGKSKREKGKRGKRREMLHSHTGSLLHRKDGGKKKKRSKPSSHGVSSGSSNTPTSHGQLPLSPSSSTGGSSEELRYYEALGRVLFEALSSVSVRVAGGVLEEQDGDKHVEYVLESTLLCHTRRFTEFKALDLSLRRKFPKLDLPKLPEVPWKLFTRRTLDPAYVAAKGKLLNEYVQQLWRIPQVRHSPELAAFLLAPQKKKVGDSFPSSSFSPSPFQFEQGKKDLIQCSEHDSSESESSDEEAETKDSVAERLETKPRLSAREHPFLNKLLEKKQSISFPGYSSGEDLVSTESLIVRFDWFDAEVCFDTFKWNKVNNVLQAKGYIDGHAIRLDAQITSFNPLSAVAMTTLC